MTQSQIPTGLEIPTQGGLKALQDHTAKLCAHFGWHETRERKFLLLIEEVGELAKAIRRSENIATEQAKAVSPEKAQANLEEEFADVLSYLFDLANGYGVDLDRAYAAKTLANFSRSWE